MRFTVFVWQIFFMLLLHAVCYGIHINSLGPTEEDLACFNDFETEVKCHLSSVSLTSCSEYKLNVTHESAGHDELNKYSCIFERSASDCECKFKVPVEFVLTENFSTELLKGVNVLFSKELRTMDFIKPKTPVLSVQMTENQNFKVTWNSMYEGPPSLVNSLRIHLTYGYEGEKKKRTLDVPNSVKFYEIIGSHLKPKTTYVLTAKMSTSHNDHRIYSDESVPREFIISSSQYELKIIPVVCVALFILIFTIFIFIFSIKKRWWDKISNPKINLGEDPIKDPTLTLMFPPTSTEISQIWVDNSKQDLKEEKKFILPSSVDTDSEKSCNSEKESVDYAQTCSVSREEVNNIARIQSELNKTIGSLLKNQPQMPPGNLGLDIEFDYTNNRDSGNCSGSSVFTNKTYIGTLSDNSSLLEPLTCDPSYMSGPNITSDNSAPFNSTINDSLERKPAEFVDDEMLNLKNLLISKNPLYPTASHVYPIACDDGYQDVQSLAKNTTGHWSPTTRAEVALGECGALKVFDMADPCTGQAFTFKQSSWTPALHIHNGIQIDDSYHPF